MRYATLDLQSLEAEAHTMLYRLQKRFDKNGDCKLKGVEWQRWYWRTFGDEIEAKEKRKRANTATE